MPAPTITLDNVNYTINGKPILQGVSCDVRSGEFLSIIGPNGAGKTTLIKCIANIYATDNNAIKLGDQPTSKLSQKDLAKLVSYVPQAEGANFPFSVSEFVLLSRYPHLSPFTSPNQKDFDAVREALIATETIDFENRPMNSLSGGQKQRVLIAAALAQQTSIVLLDEPTTFLDPKHQTDILQLLKKMHEQRDTTILMVTHDINHAALLSDRILALKDGKTAFLGNVNDCMNNKTLQPIYDKAFLFTDHPISHNPIVIPEVVR